MSAASLKAGGEKTDKNQVLDAETINKINKKLDLLDLVMIGIAELNKKTGEIFNKPGSHVRHFMHCPS